MLLVVDKSEYMSPTILSKLVTRRIYDPQNWMDSLDKRPKQRYMDMEHNMFVKGGHPNDSFEGTIQILVRFSGSAGGQIGEQWHRTSLSMERGIRTINLVQGFCT
jgi:hypothetical protein